MRRRIANIFAMGLGLLCVSLVVLGVRSFFVVDVILQSRLNTVAMLGSERTIASNVGTLHFRVLTSKPAPSIRRIWLEMWRKDRPDEKWHLERNSVPDWQSTVSWDDLLIPRIKRFPLGGSLMTTDWWEVSLPYWLAILVTSTWPTIRFTRPVLRRRREARRRSREQCLGCGYDLRAHKPGDRCPECGLEIPLRESGIGTGP